MKPFYPTSCPDFHLDRKSRLDVLHNTIINIKLVKAMEDVDNSFINDSQERDERDDIVVSLFNALELLFSAYGDLERSIQNEADDDYVPDMISHRSEDLLSDDLPF